MGNECPRCGSAVSLHDGRPFVTAHGVQLWHSACFADRDQPLPTPPSLEPPPVRYARPATIIPNRARLAGGIAAAALVAIILVGLATANTTSTAAVVNLDVSDQESPALRSMTAAHEKIPPRVVASSDEFVIPTIDAVPLDRIYPSLRGWIHPVSAATEHVPKLASRRFGSTRSGIERSECGGGHCGIDLDGPRGRPILAVAAGTIIRVERSELGADGKSGRYVRIAHDDGTITAYMHLDDVAEKIEVSDRVDAGQYIGTLGATAVYSAPPHLHFALEIPDRADLRGDHAETEYVDPAPFLSRARILPVPERPAKRLN